MKMTFQPKKRQRSKVHGFRARMSSAGGRKDHTTIIHGVNKIEDELKNNDELASKVETIKKKICV